MSAPLGNRVIGDQPWPVQPVEDRASTILALTGFPSGSPSTPAWPTPSCRGVMSTPNPPSTCCAISPRPPGGAVARNRCLQPARSCGSRTRANGGGPTVRLDPDTGAIIITNPRGGPVDPLSACDLLRDPVRWAQTPAEVVTTVDVSWQEQTTDDETGLPAPTERHEIRTDTAAEAHYGTNRLSIGTELTTAADAGTLADLLLAGVVDAGLAGVRDHPRHDGDRRHDRHPRRHRPNVDPVGSARRHDPNRTCPHLDRLTGLHPGRRHDRRLRRGRDRTHTPATGG